MKPTIKDIAKIAGVSHSTVSRSLNDSTLISDKTKKKIKKIAEDIGFVFNANARGLSLQRTGTIGIITPEVFGELKAGLFLGYIIRELRKNLDTEKYDTIVAFPINHSINESNIKKLINNRKIDGLIIAESNISSEDIDYILKSKMPHIFLHYKPDEDNKLDCIYADHFHGGYIATEHLIRSGHKNIVCVNYAPHEFEFSMRTKGYKDALIDNNIPFSEKLVFEGDLSFESGYNIVMNNWDVISNTTAAFIQTDVMALGFATAIKEKGLNIPKDYSTIGYDNIELCTFFSPPLSSVHQPIEDIAKKAIEILLQKIKKEYDENHTQIIYKPSLVIRNS